MAYKPLSTIFRVEANFTRSVNIERDAAVWLSDDTHYVVTPLAKSVVGQMVRSFLEPEFPRAWSIVGPFGSGKSAFAMALVRLLQPTSKGSRIYQSCQGDPELGPLLDKYHSVRPSLLSIRISGHRSTLTPALREGLLQALREYLVAHPSERIEVLSKALSETDPDDAKTLCHIYEQVSQAVGGLLLIVDELGKFLEFVGQRPDRADVFALQLLAEAASRSREAPLVVVTILHQAFNSYATHLSQHQRLEFQKIEGRFQKISFVQPDGEMLRVLGAALRFTGSEEQEAVLRSCLSKVAQETVRLLRIGGHHPDADLEEQLTNCAPIHPVAALLLGPLFRTLAQNERSLFAFVSSTEPFGLQEYLRQEEWNQGIAQLYTADRLYDYVISALGSGLYHGLAAKRWALVTTVVDRLRHVDQAEVRIVKLIGLMQALGNTGELRSTPNVLALALGMSLENVQKCLSDLQRKSLVVYRRYADAYRLWEGSDVDLEDCLEAAKAHVDESQGLDALLGRLLPPQPVVARKHSFVTGTLRYFTVTYCAPTTLSQALARPKLGGDGRLLFVLVDSEGQRQDVVESVMHQLPEGGTVVMPVYIPSAIREVALELQRLRWVSEHTPELSGDHVARSELRSRLDECEANIKHQLELALSPATNDLCAYWAGAQYPLPSWRALNALLSTVCDRVFNQSPHIRNELVNRAQLSSAATAARRTLLEAMLERAEEPDLGIEGHPPHLSMYRSLLRNTGIHRLVDGRYQFAAPDANERLTSLWVVFDQFLANCREQRQPISDLWAQLKEPPFGMRDGVIPVFILALLLERSSQLGLYEDGTFISQLTTPHVERLLKNPDRFEVRYCAVDEIHQEVFRHLREAGVGSGDDRVSVFVQELYRRVTRLPAYTKKTRDLPKEALSVRATLMAAHEPDVLLFQQLPLALGLPDLLVGHPVDKDVARQYGSRLSAALLQLESALDNLLSNLWGHIRESFELTQEGQLPCRLELKRKTEIIMALPLDLRIKGFVTLCGRTDQNFRSWVESVGSFVAHRAPATWSDEDSAKFVYELEQISQRYFSLAQIAVELDKHPAIPEVEVLHLGLTGTGDTGLGKVIFISPEQKLRSTQLVPELNQFLSARSLSSQDRLALLAELTRTWLDEPRKGPSKQ